jgi:hypothetical protein
MDPNEIARQIGDNDDEVICESVDRDKIINALTNAGFKQFDIFGNPIIPMSPSGKMPGAKYKGMDVVVVKLIRQPDKSFQKKVVHMAYDQDIDDITRIINNVQRFTGEDEADASDEDVMGFLDDAFFYMNGSKKIGNDIFAVSMHSLDDPTLMPPEEDETIISPDELQSMYGA